MNSKLSARGALFWSFGERYGSLVINVASTMILARILTPAQVGVFSLCAAVVAVAGILRDFGISEYLVQEKQLTRDKIRAAFTLALIVAWCIAVVVFTLRNAVADYYAEPGVAEVLAILSLNFVVLPFASPAFALMNREMAFRKIFAAQIASNAIHAATSITLAVHGFGYMSLAWASFAATLTQTVLLAFLRPRESFLIPGLKDARAVLAYGSTFISSRVIETLSNNSHEFFIAKQMGFEPVGLFGRALGLLELFYTNFTSAVLRVTTPVFASDHRNGADLSTRYANSTAMTTVFAWPFYGFVALMAGEIIAVMFGDQWAAAAPIATVLALTRMPGYLTALGPSFLAATGHVKQRLKLTLIYAPIHITGVFVASHWGLIAVAAAFGLTSLVSLFIYLNLLPRLLRCRMRDLFGASMKSAMVATACIGTQLAAHMICQAYQLNALLSLFAVGILAAISWLVAARLLKHMIYSGLLQMIDLRAAKKPFN